MLGPGGQGSDRQLAMALSQRACQQGNCGGCARPPRAGGRRAWGREGGRWSHGFLFVPHTVTPADTLASAFGDRTSPRSLRPLPTSTVLEW